MAPRTPPLTTTSYAILGLLAVRPWSTYELARQMQRALGQFWPRAESKLYEEPKKLVAHGLATATPETEGKRARTVYSITAKGRRAMAAWVPEPGDGPIVEFEQLVKVFFAEHGTKDDLLATLRGTLAWVDERDAQSAGVSHDYLEGTGAFPERLPWLILCGTFLNDFIDLVDRWATWATEVVERWPDDIRDAPPDLAQLESMARRADDRVARQSARRRSIASDPGAAV
jgi:DNA-binding PadR family transcriptional regulator